MSDERVEVISMPKAQWDEFVEGAGRDSARLDRALALLREVEWDRAVFSGMTFASKEDAVCRVCGCARGPGHAPDCEVKVLLEESDE